MSPQTLPTQTGAEILGLVQFLSARGDTPGLLCLRNLLQHFVLADIHDAHLSFIDLLELIDTIVIAIEANVDPSQDSRVIACLSLIEADLAAS